MLGRRHFNHWGRRTEQAAGAVCLLVCRCGSARQPVRWKDRNELVWTQTTENVAGKERLSVPQTDRFSISITQEHGTWGEAGERLFKKRKQEQFEDSDIHGERRQKRNKECQL